MLQRSETAGSSRCSAVSAFMTSAGEPTMCRSSTIAVQRDVGLRCQLCVQLAHVDAEQQAGQWVALPHAVAGLDGLAIAALQQQSRRRVE